MDRVQVIWGIGVMAMLIALEEVTSRDGFTAHFFRFAVGAAVFGGMTLFNWTWGVNKGHRAHRYAIYCLCAFGIDTLLDELGVISEPVAEAIALIIVAAAISVAWRDWRDLYKNYLS